MLDLLCRYACLLAVQLKMDDFNPSAHVCNVCADVNGAGQINCAAGSADIDACLLQASAKKLFCVTVHQQANAGMFCRML